MLKFIMMLFLSMGVAHGTDYKPKLPVDHLETAANSMEKKVREASVRVTVPFTGGHGSGSYIKYKDIELIFTAQHVVDGPLGVNYLITYKEESHIATLIYSDETKDIAILYLQTAFRTTKPMRYNPLKEVPDIGANIIYSGYPSTHKLMSFVGRIAGYEDGPGIGKHIILQTYGWFGCSGSMIYDTNGRQVGVLYGVDVEYQPTLQIQENLIWVVPIKNLKLEKALGVFCRGYQGRQLKACK